MTPSADLGPATAADLPALAALEEESLGVDAWSRGQLETELAGGRLLVARSTDDCAGYAAVAVAGDTADLLRIVVGSSYRRRGVATRLLTGVAGIAAGAGADRMLLEVSEANDGALAFYRRHGFAEIGRRERYYRDGTAALVLARPLGDGSGRMES